MVENIPGRMKIFKKELEKLTKIELAEFIKDKVIIIKERLEDLTKEQIIEKIVFDIEQTEFWTEYYS